MEPYGAMIERGKILRDENGGYVVASLDRDGIESPPLPSLNGAARAAGDIVYFFLFTDGKGLILGAVP